MEGSGSPREGIIANIRWSTRAQYHRIVKHLKNNREKFKTEALGNAFLNDKSRDFWAAVKKIWSNKSVHANNIDNVSDNTGISNLFAESMSLYTTRSVMTLRVW